MLLQHFECRILPFGGLMMFKYICTIIIFSNTIPSYLSLQEQEEREWWTQRFEQLSSEELEPEIKIKLASELLKSEAFDNFLGVKFVTLKRYGGEGAESMMGFFIELFQKSVEGMI